MGLTNDIIDRLRGFGDIEARALFGEHGVYRGDTIFGLAFRGRLYLKVGEGSKGGYLAKGMALPPQRAADPEVLLRNAVRGVRRPRGPAILGQGVDPGGDGLAEPGAVRVKRSANFRRLDRRTGDQT